MDAALRGGVSWGMAEEAAMEEDLDNVTEGAMLGIHNHARQHNHAWQHNHAQQQPCNIPPKTRFYSAQAFSSSDFQCRDDVSEAK